MRITSLARVARSASASRSLHVSAAGRHASGAQAAAAGQLPPPFTAQGSLRMRAAVARGAMTALRVEQVALRAPRSDEVLVRLHATGLCHTDVAVKERGLCTFPFVLGHEGAGIVERVGSSVTDVKVGDRVLLSYASCGSCPHCMVGKPAYCFSHGAENFGGRDTVDGQTTHRAPMDAEAPALAGEEIHGSFFRQSSFAQFSLATMNNIVKVPSSASELDLALLAPLGCGIQTGAGAVLNTLRPPVGSRIAVFGAGAVGLAAVMGARLAGARTVVAVDRNAARLQLAREMGATDTLLVTGTESAKENVERIRALSSGGYEYSLDTTGNPTSLRTALDVINPLGTCGLIGGAAPGVEVPVDMLGLLPGKQLRGIIQGDSVSKLFLPQLIDAHQAGLFPFHRMITYYQGLEQINQAVSDVKDPKGTVIKPVIRIEQ